MRTLRVQPIYGKFLSSTINGETINVWLVDPKTNEQGTELPYDKAVALLTMRHPVAALVQVKDKNGKYVQQMTDDELKNLEAKRQENIANNTFVPEKNTDDGTLKALVETQAELLKSQRAEIDSMRSEFKEMKKLLKKSGGKGKSKDEE